ncbi:MAG: DUF5684 domain-containing protein [Crocinitomicaceae bacterium]
MKLFLKEFGIWMGGLLLVHLLLSAVLAEALPYGFFVVTQWLFPAVGVIIAITRLKTKHNVVSFGQSLGAGVVVAVGYMIAGTLMTAILYPDYIADAMGYMLQAQLIQFLILCVVVLYILMLAGIWYTLKKAGKPGYAFLIPIYNIIVFLEVAQKPLWWFIMFLIPIANIVFAIMMLNAISKNFGKDEGFTVGLIFLSPIFWSILGYGDAKYLEGQHDTNLKAAGEDVLDDF